MREPDALDDAVARADLFRSRQAAFGPARHPEALRFAASVVSAMSSASPSAAVGNLPLPDVPAVVCDHADRIVRSNAAFHRLAGAAGDADLFGMRLSQILTGSDRDARLLRTDGNTVGVGVVRFGPLDDGLAVVALVERNACAEGRVDRAWAAELERLARVGTWSFDLATGVLARSDTLEELYRDVGLDADDPQRGGVERRQAQTLRAALAAGATTPRRPHRAASGRRCSAVLPGGGRVDGRRRPAACHRRRPRRQRDEAARTALRRPHGRHARRRGRAGPAGRIVATNPGLCALLGAPAERLRGMAARVLAAEPPTGGRPSWLRPVPPGAQYGYRVEAAPLLRADGTTIWCELDVTATSAEDGSIQWLVIVTDVSERRRAAEVLRRAGRVDELTRLPNRAACLELLDRAAGRAGTGARRRRVRRRRRLPARQLLPRPRGGRRPARHAGRAAAARPAGRLQRSAAVRRRVRGDLRRPRRGGRPRPARRDSSPTSSAR